MDCINKGRKAVDTEITQLPDIQEFKNIKATDGVFPLRFKSDEYNKTFILYLSKSMISFTNNDSIYLKIYDEIPGYINQIFVANITLKRNIGLDIDYYLMGVSI